MKNKLFLVILITIFLLASFTLSFAHETNMPHEEPASSLNLPSNIQKIADYNVQQADFYFRNISFFIAFLAGILSILTPCSLAILPAFFAYTFEEKKQLTKMTLAFFLGFMPIFVIFGLIATFLGQTIITLQQNFKIFTIIAGIFIISFGLMTLFGKGFSFLKFRKQTAGKNTMGVFLFGLLFGLGFTACLGPILVGILLMASILQNYLYAGMLMVFYSLGMFVPLFLISFFFDKYNFSAFINKINKKLGFSIANLIAGLLLIGIGIVFIIFGGTFITHVLGLGSLAVFIYSIQDKLFSLRFINIIGVIILIGFLALLWMFLRKNKNDKKAKRKNSEVKK